MPKAVFVVLLVFVGLIVLGAVWVGVSYAIVSPPGSAVTEERRVYGFTKVTVHGAGTLIITQGSAPSLVVEGKRPVLDRLTTRVSGDTLLLDPHGVWYAPITYSGADRVTYHLTVTELTGIEANGATRVESVRPLTVRELSLSTSGAAKLALELAGQAVTVHTSGAGEITLSGSADVLDFKSSGAAKLHARDLHARQATIDCSGAAKVEVDAGEELNVTLSGAGRVSYTGDPRVTQSISGAGKVGPAK